MYTKRAGEKMDIGSTNSIIAVGLVALFFLIPVPIILKRKNKDSPEGKK
jgi:hypothetical protein